MSEIQTKLHYDASTDGLIIERVQDVEQVLEYAKRQHLSGEHGGPDMKHAASIPAVLVEAYCNQHGITFAEFMGSEAHAKAMLNDKSLAHFRIWKGRV